MQLFLTRCSAGLQTVHIILLLGVFQVFAVYFDINSYLRYGPGRHILDSAEYSLAVQFRYCNDKGILFYQSDQNSYLAFGVNSRRIYMEWKTSGVVIELYIGDGSLVANQTYLVQIYNLANRNQTQSTINGLNMPVDYLMTVDETLSFSSYTGDLYIGGYSDVSVLQVNTERLTAYLGVCLDFIQTFNGMVNLSSADQSVGVYQSCPSDFCAPPTVITLTSNQSYVELNVPLTPRTKTQISFRFRTRASRGMLFYLGGPAYLTLFMTSDSRLGLGLNTKGSNVGAFNYSTLSNYNDGQWYYVQVSRNGNVATLTNDLGQVQAMVKFGVDDSAALTLNAQSLVMGGVKNPKDISQLPPDAQVSLTGCMEAPRFIIYSIASEPAPLLNFDTQLKDERNVTHGGCFTNQVCVPPCPSPSQYCNLSCGCSPGFYVTSLSPSLVCRMIDFCTPNPCLFGSTCVGLILDYNCQCTVQYNKGKNCDIINHCLPSPCMNGATCNDWLTNYTCSCPPGYTDSNCSTNIDECSSHPCSNGGSCIDLVAAFVCTCSPGFTGTSCQTEINECDSNPCHNGGQCVNNINAYTCICTPGWQGSQCADDINECNSSPCLNGATCINGINLFTCSCIPGYTGALCQTDINECISQPCMNGATCLNLLNYYSCACTSGFTGNQCQTNVNECSSTPCYNGGTCIDRVNMYQCVCPAGFNGPTCAQDINECLSSPCLNNATCLNLIAKFSCVCPTGFQGNVCQYNIDDCNIPAPNQCQNGAKCIDGINSYTCQCQSGWTGQFCQQDVNECLSFPCQNNGTCLNQLNSYSCICPPSFTGLVCSDDVNECLTRPCQNYISCINTYGSYVCTCLPGYTGQRCDVEIDECASNPCYFNGTCHNIVNGYTCTCWDGFMGVRCEAVIRQCQLYNPCSNNAVCVEKPTGGYTCYCKPGFSGVNCSMDIDECLSNPCFNGGTCTDLVNAYNCTCSPGYTGPYCKVDVDECASDPCQNQGVCTQPLVAMYRCVCPPGYNGTNCEILIDNCASSPCPTWQNCTNQINNFICSCPSGYTGDRCDTPINKCQSNPCQNGGSCLSIPNGFLCQCAVSWGGVNCQTKTDICYPNPCLNFGTCYPDSTVSIGYRCLCTTGFIGNRCQGDVYQCRSNPCQNNGSCLEWTAGINGFECICSVNFTGTFCETDARTCAAVPCLNGATCLPSASGYQCVCSKGWSGNQCQQNINECLTLSPCLNGGVCIDTSGSYICLCPPPLTGSDCGGRISPCTSSPCSNGTLCVDSMNGSFSCQCMPGSNCSNACDSKPCMNNGVCILTSLNTYQCNCTNGVTGKNCESVMFATFGGNNYLQIPGSPNSVGRRKKRQDSSVMSAGNNLTSLSLAFMTTVTDGIIIYALGIDDSQEYLLMELFNATLRFSVGSLQSTTVFSLPLSVPPFGILTTQVDFVLSNGLLSLTLNSSTCQMTPDCHVSSNVNSSGLMLGGPMYVGGVPHWTPFMRSKAKSTNGYSGCLGNILINGQPVNLASQLAAVQSRADQPPTKPQPGCLSHEPCTPGYCSNHGTCVDLWTEKFCACSPAFTGLQCQMQALSYFSGDALMTFANTSLLSVTQVGFDISLNSSSGFIIYTLTGTPLCIVVDQWHLVVHIQQASGDLEAVSQMDMSDGNWYGVRMAITSQFLTFTVVDHSGTTLYTNTLTPSFQSISGPVYVGRLHSNLAGNIWQSKFPLFNESFHGCMRNLTLNGGLVDLQTSLPSGFGNDPPPPLASCPREDQCTSQPCASAASCTSSWSGHQCTCPAGYTDQNCTDSIAALYDGHSSYTEMFVDTSTVSFGDSFSFNFRTRQSSGSLMFVQFLTNNSQPFSSISVQLTSGQLQMTTNSSAGTANVIINGNYSDGSWCRFNLENAGPNFNARINDSNQTVPNNVDVFSSSRTDLVLVYFGSQSITPGSSGVMIDFIKACLQDVRFNHNPVQLFSNSSGISVTNSFVSPGCKGDAVCSSNPCPSTASCEDVWNAYSCKCPLGTVAPFCNASSNCTNNLCTNGASCATLDSGGYRCVCGSNFTGVYCEETIQPCSSNPCTEGHYTSCQNTSPTNYLCVCSSGWTGNQCQINIDECASAPCLNNGVCIDLVNGYNCSCDTVHSGTRCESTLYCTSQPCRNGGTCSESLTGYICTCPPSQAGSQCEIMRPCISSPCQNGGSCSESQDFTSFNCTCIPPYYGVICANVNSNLNTCYANACTNGATCRIKGNIYECICLPNFFGPRCEYYNSCLSYPCQNSGVCKTQNETYLCSCLKNFTGQNCDQQMALPCLYNPCLNNATCYINAINYNTMCTCPVATTGLHCETVFRDCLSSPCQNNGLCSSTSASGYVCQCEPGYTGIRCETVINTCLSSPCQNKGLCSSTSASGYVCQCEPGYTGIRCETVINTCASNPCRNGGSCTGIVNGYRCVCTTGYTGSNCELSPGTNPCSSNPCLNGGSCNGGSSNSYQCVCPTGFQGTNCEQDLRGCSSAPCLNNGTCNIAVIPNYFCSCAPGFGGTYCQNCTFCLNNGRCLTGSDQGLSCNCSKTGYKGLQCQDDIDECVQFPCQNNGTCLNTPGSYRCFCSQNWTGVNCDCAESDSSCSSPLTSNGSLDANTKALIISIVVLGVALILILLLIYTAVRSRKFRGKYKPSKVEKSGSVPMKTFPTPYYITGRNTKDEILI